MVHSSVSRPFITMLKDRIHIFYAISGKVGLEYGKIYNVNNFRRIVGLAEKSDHGGEFETSLYAEEKNLQINPILIKNPHKNSKVFNSKTSGPVLPIVEYSQHKDLIEGINVKDNVENLLYFSKNTRMLESAVGTLKFKSLYFNDTNRPTKCMNSWISKPGRWMVGNTALMGEQGFSTFTKQTFIYHGQDLSNTNTLMRQMAKFPLMNKFSRRYLVNGAYALCGLFTYKYIL